MKAFFDEIHNNYDILNLSYDELIEFSGLIDSCDLPKKRTFYKLKKEIENLIAIKRLPKKVKKTVNENTLKI